VVSDLDPSDHHMVWMDLVPTVSIQEAVKDLNATWSGGAVTLTWTASAGYVYRVQQSPTMAANSWVDTGINPVATAGSLATVATIPAGVPGRMFYRVQGTFAP
jgi:hypothetical protein